MGFSRVRTKEDESAKQNKPFFKTKNAKESNTYFVKKSLANGTLFFEVGMCEPFVYMKFYGLESKATAAGFLKEDLMPKAAMSSEILEIRKSIHMHSFTFDFHLRTIGNNTQFTIDFLNRAIHFFFFSDQLVSGKPMFRKGYHLVHFLDDFMSYYNKGPNFARNAIHKGSIDIACNQPWINANQLYNYVLSHETVYQFTVVRMEPIYIEESDQSNLELDYALVRHSTYKMKREDFNVTLVVSFDKKKAQVDSLSLNFYILISMKEINPTSYNNESQSGIFRTVSKAKKETTNDIQSEEVNWIGYYSTHEQSMEEIMHVQVIHTKFCVSLNK